MANILFVTCDRWPQISQSDALVVDALTTLGHRVEPAPWQGDFTHFQAADLILLRSQWDYHYDIAGFTTWLDRLEADTLPVYNPVELVRWNLHKRYLFDLQALGVLIPTSRVLKIDETPETIYQQQGWAEAVIKPLAGASGHLVERVELADLASWSDRVRSQRATGEWLIQEFRPEIQASGEISLVFLTGTFSHAVVKQPDRGEFRISSQYSGQISRVEPPAAILQQAQHILSCLPIVPLYARVDGIISDRGDFLLIELELNEPGLYFSFAPEQAAQFAEAIQDKLG